MAAPIIPLPFGQDATDNGVLGSTITQDFGEGVREPIDLTGSDGDLGSTNDHGKIDPNHFIDRYFYYAIDFGLDVGTKVLAEGSGHVVGTSQNDVVDNTLGPSPYLGNYITISYDDGIFATYIHLEDGSIPQALLDTPSAQVSVGQEIGDVGLTGATGGHHLHVTYGAQLVTTTSGVTMADGSLAGNPLGVPVAFKTGQLSDGTVVWGPVWARDC